MRPFCPAVTQRAGSFYIDGDDDRIDAQAMRDEDVITASLEGAEDCFSMIPAILIAAPMSGGCLHRRVTAAQSVAMVFPRAFLPTSGGRKIKAHCRRLYRTVMKTNRVLTAVEQRRQSAY